MRGIIFAAINVPEKELRDNRGNLVWLDDTMDELEQDPQMLATQYPNEAEFFSHLEPIKRPAATEAMREHLQQFPGIEVMEFKEEGLVFIRVNAKWKEEFFNRRFLELQERVRMLSLKEFANDEDAVWRIKQLLGAYGDMLYIDNDLVPFDQGIRLMQPDTWYAIYPSVVMH